MKSKENMAAAREYLNSMKPIDDYRVVSLDRGKTWYKVYNDGKIEEINEEE